MEQLTSTLSKRQRIDLQRFLYRELIRLSTMVDHNVSEPQIFGLMSALVKKAKYAVNGETTAERIAQLLDFVYREQGFECDYNEYFHTDNLLIHKVLRRKRGMPVSLGAILLNLAVALDLPLYPVNFPTQLLIRAEYLDENGRQTVRFINPGNGAEMSFREMEKLVEGEMGYHCPLEREFTEITTKDALLERVETVYKMALLGERKFEKALDLIEYRLIFDPENPYEIRDRGMILASLDCYQAAVEDFNYFIDQCPDDPSAIMLKSDMLLLQQQANRTNYN